MLCSLLLILWDWCGDMHNVCKNCDKDGAEMTDEAWVRKCRKARKDYNYDKMGKPKRLQQVR